ncbi:hypothetical protein ACFSAV_08210 [Pasteurella oralis]|uniref:Type II secretory pathway, component PulJ n=1 Tax=Pasteurella oralis TaxID=1071947 RepID=A0ABW4NVM2_9PAST|nr:type II secretion system protein J [Pasteurella oralis]MDO5055653.1 type II secretion system protein J [Pasteurella oralis]
MLYRGQTLLSLLLSLSLSSFLLFVFVTFYVHSQRQNQYLFLHLQLQSELQRVIRLIAKDIRRAGFRAFSAKTQQTNFSLFEQAHSSLQLFSINEQNEQDCVLFFYDLDTNGCLGEKFKGKSCVVGEHNNTTHVERELFGYRLNQGMIETRLTYKSAVNSHCKLEECQTFLQKSACTSGGWVDLLDKKEYVIRHLRFHWVANKRGIEMYLAGYMQSQPTIFYETSAVIPLLNTRSL